MKTVYKYELPSSRGIVHMPFCAKLLHVSYQFGAPVIWAEVDTDAPVANRHFMVATTGSELPTDVSLIYIGTLFVESYVYHVFEEMPLVPQVIAQSPTPPITTETTCPQFKRTHDTVQAFRVTVGNLEGLAAWCRGSVKGTMLPRGQQCIEFISFDREIRADVGDWIVKESPDNFNAYPNEIFEKVFKSC